jgi:hypothetical protein
MQPDFSDIVFDLKLYVLVISSTTQPSVTGNLIDWSSTTTAQTSTTVQTSTNTATQPSESILNFYIRIFFYENLHLFKC